MSEFNGVDAGAGPLGDMPPKPKAAWIVQISAAICIVSLLVGLTQIGTLVATDSSNMSMKLALISASWRTLAVGLLFVAIVGTHRRNSYGRVLGLLFIAVVFLGLLYRKSVGPVESSPWRLSYTNQQVGETAEAVGDLLTLFIIGYWFYAFGLSRRAREFFGLRGRECSGQDVSTQKRGLQRYLTVFSIVIAGIGLLKLLSLGVSQLAFFASSSLANATSKKDAEVAMVHAKAAAQVVEAYHRKHSEYPTSLTAAEFEAPLPEPVQSIRVNSVTGGVQVVILGQGSSTSRTFFWEPTIDAAGVFVWTCRPEEIPVTRMPKDCLPGAKGIN